VESIDPVVEIRLADEDDIEEVSRLRLEALCTEPTAFSSDYDAARTMSLDEWAAWFHARTEAASHGLFVASTPDGLAGMAGIAREDSPKTRHSGFMWGVFVRPDARGRRIGRLLTEACLQWADEVDMETVRLDVNSVNVAAIRLYASCGFRVVGMMPKALKVDGVAYDELIMVREMQAT